VTAAVDACCRYRLLVVAWPTVRVTVIGDVEI
jgi:hypothetical protein